MAMIDSQLRASGVMDRGILSAMAELPRELFVAEHRRPVAYVDDVQPLAHGRFLLSPSQFARIAQLAKIAPTDRVLDVGTASGYSAAILARQAREVVAAEHVEQLGELARKNLETLGVSNVSLVSTDDALATSGQFDAIIVEGALDGERGDLLKLLAPNGRLVAPILKRGVAVVGTYSRGDRGVMFTSAFDATMPRLRNDVVDDEFRF
ncbi:protein-L-isoaspartate O-methyltransferase [Devosia sp. BK]|uniref:protein-L-isoaspartate O-methyltransferase family protein n=1 Tax=Devosia sp. BK TaxID=2871706 RepID=UPI00293A3EF4|nr:protein-L-isoaspartate O-methyltransferase [Devosia sp. BK]MDV3250794.1 protein-L-isoaspartate O-methyltransferase [Devosia sp. BK]